MVHPLQDVSKQPLYVPFTAHHQIGSLSPPIKSQSERFDDVSFIIIFTVFWAFTLKIKKETKIKRSNFLILVMV
jgi:hypothetical protein